MTTLAAPVDWIETMSELKLPSQADSRLQELMDLNNEGELSKPQLTELEMLVEWSQQLSLVRARALHLLGRAPR